MRVGFLPSLNLLQTIMNLLDTALNLLDTIMNLLHIVMIGNELIAHCIMYCYYEIQIMNSVINPSREDLLAQLKNAKNQMLKSESKARQNISGYFLQLRQISDNCEHQFNLALNTSTLNYHQQMAELCKTISRTKNTPNEGQIELAKQMITQKLGSTSTVPISKVQQILKSAFKLSISEENPVSQTHIRFFSQLQRSESMMNQSNSAYEVVIEKLQCERDYFQKKQLELGQRLKQLQGSFSKKGVNIKQMSKSYLEEKCSKWAMERLKEENRVLVEKIGTASQEIIKLNQQLANIQEETRKIGVFYSQNKSVISSTTIKNNSVIVESDNTKRQKMMDSDQLPRQKQIQLQLKNQQLLIEITKCMTNIQEQAQTIKCLQKKIQECHQRISQKEKEFEDLKQNYQLINHDYELSLKRKAAFEQQCRQIKIQVLKANENLLEQRQIYKNLIAQFESKEKDIVRRVKEIQESKKEETAKLCNKLKVAEEQHQKLIKTFEENSVKKGEDINYKALLHQQINKLRKNNATLDQQLQLKEESLYVAKQVQAKLTGEANQLQMRIQVSKKQTAKLKKQIKQQEKLIAECQQRIQVHENMENKIISLQQSLNLLQAQFTKYKQISERKALINQKMMAHVKQKFTLQMNALLSQDNKQKSKKANQTKLDIIDKYIEEMMTLSNKTAQIKQLKEEINQLKQPKDIKSLLKKGKLTSINESVSLVQGGILNLATKIMQQRITTDKQLYEARISQLNEQLVKQLLMRTQVEQQLQKERLNVQQFQLKQKQTVFVEQKTKSTKILQDKIQKIENQLKSARFNGRKLQNQNNKLECQVKTKKELAAGLKKECKEREDQIKVITTELTLVKDELQKTKRYIAEANKKESMFKDIKQRKERVDEENLSLKKAVQSLQERIKLLNKQIAKKDQLLKDVRDVEDRQIRMREDVRFKEASQTIEEQKQVIRKLRCDLDRKQDILKNIKQKNEAKHKQFQQSLSQKERLLQKSLKQNENLQRKLQNQKGQNKKQENKNYQLIILVKKIFQMTMISQKDQPKTAKIRQSTNYYSGSTVSPHQIKFASPASQIKKTSNDLREFEGLKILDLRPEDIEGIMGETTVLSRVTNNEQSWSMVSPIVTKNHEKVRQQQLLHGLQQLQRLLALKQPKNSQILQIFKRVIKLQ